MSAMQTITRMAATISQSRNSVPTHEVSPVGLENVAVNLYVCPKYTGALSVIEPEATGFRSAPQGIPLFSSIPVRVPDEALVDFQDIKNPIVVSFPEASDCDTMISGSTVRTQVGEVFKHWVDELAETVDDIASIFSASCSTSMYKLAKTLGFVVSAKLIRGRVSTNPARRQATFFMAQY